uniref:Uncharacterized protein n=1 Tax=Plectus sambesii TaxID=2011161 RepID=A0A914WZ33_9BILA
MPIEFDGESAESDGRWGRSSAAHRKLTESTRPMIYTPSRVVAGDTAAVGGIRPNHPTRSKNARLLCGRTRSSCATGAAWTLKCSRYDQTARNWSSSRPDRTASLDTNFEAIGRVGYHFDVSPNDAQVISKKILAKRSQSKSSKPKCARLVDLDEWRCRR